MLNNCIFLKIFAFEILVKRTACSYLRKNPSLLQGFTRISCFKMAKSCCFESLNYCNVKAKKFMTIDFSRVKICFAAGLPFLILNKNWMSVCLYVYLTLSFHGSGGFRLVPNTTTRGCESKFDFKHKMKRFVFSENLFF